MRVFKFLLLSLLLAFSAVAADVSIRTLSKDGQEVYELDAGAFPQENSALQLKLRLSSLLKQPVTIQHLPDRKLYVVKIGPIAELEQAKAIQAQLKSENFITSPVKKTTVVKDFQNEEEPPLLSQKKLWNLVNADIRAVIAEVSRVTGKNFIIDPRVQGKISIVSSTPLSDRALYQVFLSMLQVSGYSAIPSGDIIKIIPNIDAKSASYDALRKGGRSPKGDEMLIEVIPVQYVPAEQLIPVLRPLMPQWSTVSAYMPSNMLILSGQANNIRHMAEIIRQVDTSNARGIDVVPLHYALAMDVANTLKDLMKTQAGGNQGDSGHAHTTIAADDRSNSILLSGSKTERIRLRILIHELDRENRSGGNSNTQVIYLSYLRAEDLAPILAGVAQANFSGTVGTTIGTITLPTLDSTNPASNIAGGVSSSGSGGNMSAPTPPVSSHNASGPANTTGVSTQNEGGTKPTVQIIAEPNTNSIIINAPAAVIRILKSVIAQLDIKPAQLLIEAMIAKVNENDVKSLGIEWGTNLQTGVPGNFRPGFAILNTDSSISDFQAQIYALATQRKANILSTPTVVVLDNRQAKILVGQQVSVAESSQPANAGGTTNNSVPFTTFSRVNVALHLYVRPQITRGQGIHLQIDQGNETIQPGTELSTNPIFNISSIVTAVHVQSGDVIVLGGLTQDSLANDNNKIPIIGDIPGVGKLFRHEITTRDKQVLMVFIRPIILRTERDNFEVSGAKYNSTRQYQLDWMRPEEYDQRNEQTLLPPLKQAALPKPFRGPRVAVTKGSNNVLAEPMLLLSPMMDTK